MHTKIGGKNSKRFVFLLSPKTLSRFCRRGTDSLPLNFFFVCGRLTDICFVEFFVRVRGKPEGVGGVDGAGGRW